MPQPSRSSSCASVMKAPCPPQTPPAEGHDAGTDSSTDRSERSSPTDNSRRVPQSALDNVQAPGPLREKCNPPVAPSLVVSDPPTRGSPPISPLTDVDDPQDAGQPSALGPPFPSLDTTSRGNSLVDQEGSSSQNFGPPGLSPPPYWQRPSDEPTPINVTAGSGPLLGGSQNDIMANESNQASRPSVVVDAICSTPMQVEKVALNPEGELTDEPEAVTVVMESENTTGTAEIAKSKRGAAAWTKRKNRRLTESVHRDSGILDGPASGTRLKRRCQDPPARTTKPKVAVTKKSTRATRPKPLVANSIEKDFKLRTHRFTKNLRSVNVNQSQGEKKTGASL